MPWLPVQLEFASQGDPLDERELERIVNRYGQPRRRHHILMVGEGFLEPGGEHRQSEVVLVIRRPNGKVLLHTKSFYPSGVYRLPSGGVGRGEGVVEAALREAREETGLEAEMESFLGLLEYELRWGEETRSFTSSVFLLRALQGEPAPSYTDERASPPSGRWPRRSLGL